MVKKSLIISILGLLAILLIGYGFTTMTNSTETCYHYSINLGAPRKYEMVYDFNENYFTDHTGKPLLRFAIIGGSPADDWGQGNQATLLSERNPLPSGIKVRWFSVAEDQFWEGTYQFDQQRLNRLVQTKVNDIIDSTTKNLTEYFEFTINMVPGGLVTIWILGEGNQYIVAQFQANKVDEPDWDKFSRILERGKDFHISRADFIKERLTETTTEMGKYTQQEIIQGKLPTDSAPWKRMMLTYPWILAVNDEFILKDYFTRYTSAEQYYTYQDQNQFSLPPRPVPIYLSYYIEEVVTHKLNRLNLLLDPEETMTAFAQLNNAKPLHEPIKLFLSINDSITDIDVYVIKGQQSIALKNMKTQLTDLYNR